MLVTYPIVCCQSTDSWLYNCVPVYVTGAMPRVVFFVPNSEYKQWAQPYDLCWRCLILWSIMYLLAACHNKQDGVDAVHLCVCKDILIKRNTSQINATFETVNLIRICMDFFKGSDIWLLADAQGLDGCHRNCFDGNPNWFGDVCFMVCHNVFVN